MKQGTDRLLKFQKLMIEMKWDKWQTKGLLQSIWDFTGDNALPGDIGKYSNEDIALGIDYKGDADQLITVLMKHRWLDEHPDPRVRLVVHDWHDHLEDIFKKRIKRIIDSGGSFHFASLNITSFPPKQLSLPETADDGGRRRTTADDGGRRLPSCTDSGTDSSASADSRTDTENVGSVGDSAKDSTTNALNRFSIGGKAAAELLNRVMRQSRDGPAYRQWWLDVALLMDRTGGLYELTAAVHYAEMCDDPHQRDIKGLGILKKPGAYMAGQCRDWLKKFNLSLPVNPKKTANG